MTNPEDMVRLNLDLSPKVNKTEASPKTYSLEKLIETFGAWEDDRTTEDIIKDIYDSRTISNSDYIL